MGEVDYTTVTVLNNYIHHQFENDAVLSHTIHLTGEISNFRLRPGHQYFSLKDDDSAISAVMFQSDFNRLKFEPKTGMKVRVSGRVSTYVRNGQYQFYVRSMEPDGLGQLYLALQQLKAKLAQEGLFDEDHKKALPKYPHKIGVITSQSGAVIRDIIKTVHLRYPIAQVVLYPAVVQGTASAPDLVRQLHRLEQRDDIDTIIIGRGGGSFEDLYSFNDETLARAIYNCPVPIISSVGHQTDNTIADLVADRRAATPTAAAEFAVPELDQLLSQVQHLKQETIHYFTNQLTHQQQRLDQLTHQYIFQHPAKLYEAYLNRVNRNRQMLTTQFDQLLQQRQRALTTLQYRLNDANPKKTIETYQHQLQMLDQKLKMQMQQILQTKQQRYHQLSTSLKQLNPKSIMKNGYSYVTKDHQVVTDIDEVHVDDTIVLNLVNGQLKVKVLDLRKDE